jgi:8-oxo-dGTP diphosphatase
VTDAYSGVESGGKSGNERAIAAAKQPVIRVSALFAVDEAGRLLVVRKRGTSVFMQPGGKPEPGESAAQTLVRELAEEVGVRLELADLEPLGTFITDAANEAGTTLIADVFRATITQLVRAAAEIDEVRWMLPQELATARVAPLITQHMLELMPIARPTP